MSAVHPRQIDGSTRLLGLLGQDAFYTLSPSMHNRAIQIFGLDQIYVNFNLAQESVSTFLDIFWKLGGVGLNITKPHKNLVASLLPGEKLGSVNTLVRGSDGWVGYSTDGAGFATGLERMDVSIEEVEHLVMMGSGGAAQSIIDYIVNLPRKKLQTIHILRRGTHRDKQLMDLVSDKKIKLKFQDWSAGDLNKSLHHSNHRKTLLVQGASVSSNLEPALKEFTSALAGYQGAFVDLIYDKPSALYFAALDSGIKTQDGLPMLIEQARLSQKLWWGKAASYEDLVIAIKNTGKLG